MSGNRDAMIAFVADENFSGTIMVGLRRRLPELDVLAFADTGIGEGADDPTILAWAAEAGRVLLTHDARTMAGYAYDRVRGRLPMPGVIEVNQQAPIGWVIEQIEEQIELAAFACGPEEFDAQVRFLPL